MSLKHVMELYEVMDSMYVNGEVMKEYLHNINPAADVVVKTIKGENGSTDFVRVLVKGKSGKSSGGHAPTLGIIGRLGGIGARPEMTGFVSDGDGALACMAGAAKAIDMALKGDQLEGDVIFSTHICPTAPTLPHEPVPFMNSPVDISVMNENEVEETMDAILSIDTTKGNQVCNHKGFAITPTVKEGYILKISDDLLQIYTQSAGIAPVVLPLTMQDITPYGNGLFHINSILQPAVATSSPVVGVAITTESIVAGCATGATHVTDVENVVRFVLEVAKTYGAHKCSFFDQKQFTHMKNLYGSMKHLQTKGNEVQAHE
ncbi:DUF1177 domain-containing protein [Lysinibacillus fusiformis]|uniref:DUF1177 domain-containing protein n=1 Tax=Lysinibacillus fusiformis TaxID=28031 RepID=UPI00263BCE5E|nr:DUF1177 domain-containing protein [Lysinibacillus fusiformis]MDC6268250.1 DUF1177 domain-containing protein [Lysinibacillus sphaericus]MDN4967260.1 DUF1177 domain-containing protein [Lysinibacillus fusiformis]